MLSAPEVGVAVLRVGSISLFSRLARVTPEAARFFAPGSEAQSKTLKRHDAISNLQHPGIAGDGELEFVELRVSLLDLNCDFPICPSRRDRCLRAILA